MTKDQSSQDPIRLELGATAEPRTWVSDGSMCHLHKHTGKAYITQILVRP